jgi:hypothetical protein
MARTETTASRERTTLIRRYPWPENLLNYWTIIMLATGGLLTGVFASFMSIQSRMGLGTPWLFPYAVTVGSLTLFFVILMIVLLAQRKLQPAWVLLGSFILIALFLAGLIETAVQLFGNVSLPFTISFSLPPHFLSFPLLSSFPPQQVLISKAGQRKHLLQPLRQQQQHPRRLHRYTGLVRAKQHLLPMGCCIRFLDHWSGFLGLDDGCGSSGE